jgi:hypothetical protein
MPIILVAGIKLAGNIGNPCICNWHYLLSDESMVEREYTALRLNDGNFKAVVVPLVELTLP